MSIITVAIGVTFKNFYFIINSFDWAVCDCRMSKGIRNIGLEEEFFFQPYKL